MDAEREPTKGEKLVGLTFNPSGDENVTNIKKAAAAFIDSLEAIQPVVDATAQNWVDVAIDHIIIAQMLAVKAATWKGLI